MKLHRILASLLAIFMLASTAPAQPAYAPPPPGAVAALYAPEQLDQMLAPIALYPDPLLTSILTAATYPVEVDAAAQWLRNPGATSITGDALAAELQNTNWDPSVKSLVPFPQVLAMMDQQLAWTQALGNAFLAQQPDVMNSIQRLRRAALAAGTLVSSPYESVSDDGTYITISPAQQQLVYVPVYNPTAIYGTWPYPGYLPDYFGPPPGLAARFSVGALGFSIGFGVVDALWNWGDWDWRDHSIHVDPARFNRINAGRPPISAATWQHDPAHRDGAPYLDAATRGRFEKPAQGSADQRGQFRFGAAQPQAAAPAQERRAPSAPAAVPPTPPARSPTAFDAVTRGPQAQVEVVRGQQSRQAAAAPAPPRPAPPRPAPPRPAPPRPAAPAPARAAAPAPQRPAAPAQRPAQRPAPSQQQPERPGERPQ